MDLGKWAFNNRTLVLFLVWVLVVGGIYSAWQMSKLEDPEIKVKMAMVVTVYPGASAHEVEMQVTDPLEKRIRTMSGIDNIESYSYADMSIMQVELLSTINPKEIEQYWDILRHKVSDAQADMPDGARPSIVRDDFSNVYGMFYALTGDGMSERELSDYAEMIKREIGNIEDVDRVSIYGQQKECIEVRLRQDRMSALGVSPIEVLRTLGGQNSAVYAGYYDNGDQRVRVQVADRFNEMENIRRMLIAGHESEQMRMTDIAVVETVIERPVRNEMLRNGQRSLGIMIAPTPGADVVKVGAKIEKHIATLKAERFPAGMKLEKVFYQPDRVTAALGDFLINLVESVAIVVLILMFTMGFKSGSIIGISLVVIVMGTFLLLIGFGGTMQRVSLAAFILAMGMLVDNAIVIIDGILVDMKRGLPRTEALTNIGKRTAMPLLGATLIAILSFLPIFMSPDTAGIYVRDLFIVLAVSLMLSWILALVHVPLMADRWIKSEKKEGEKKDTSDPYDSAMYRILRNVLVFGMKHRLVNLVIMVGVCFLAVIGYGHMKQGFFPDMEYDQAYMEYKLDEGANTTRVKKDLQEIEAWLKTRPEVTNVTMSIGGTPGRYNLVRTIATPSLSYGELIIDFTSPEALKKNINEIQDYLTKHYPEAYCKLKMYNLMFKKYPIEAQFSGPDPAVLHKLSKQAEEIMKQEKDVCLITTNWEPSVPVLEIEYDQTQARRGGLSRSDVGMSTLMGTGGIPFGVFKEGIYSKNMYVKVETPDYQPISDLSSLQVFSVVPNISGLLTKENVVRLRTGHVDKEDVINAVFGTIPLGAVTNGIEVKWEDPVVPRYNGMRMQRVQCSPAPGCETERTRKKIAEKIDKIELPEGYKLEWMGERQASVRSMKYLFANFPLAVILMIAILIALFKNYRKTGIILCTIPLMGVGIVLTMLATGKIFSFVAIVGALGLIGMVIKNGIVLMDEIDLQLSEGACIKDALINSALSRLRPVSMASLTTILGMIPLLGDAMFGSLAVTIMGGLFFGTIITLVFVPILYTLFFNVKIR